MKLRFKQPAIKTLAYLLVGLFVLLTVQGCSKGVSAPSLGTPGILTSADQPCADFEVRVYSAAQTAPLGVGLTGLDGKFGLSNPDGSGACWLTPGEYRVSVESTGPAALKLPPAYSDPQKTPLKITWKAEDSELKLALPALK